MVFEPKTGDEGLRSLVGSEMGIRDGRGTELEARVTAGIGEFRVARDVATKRERWLGRRTTGRCFNPVGVEAGVDER